MDLTPAQVSELCARSASGDGVRAVLAEWGCDDVATMTWLQANAHARLVASKKEQNSGAVPMSAKARERARREG